MFKPPLGNPFSSVDTVVIPVESKFTPVIISAKVIASPDLKPGVLNLTPAAIGKLVLASVIGLSKPSPPVKLILTS